MIMVTIDPILAVITAGSLILGAMLTVRVWGHAARIEELETELREARQTQQAWCDRYYDLRTKNRRLIDSVGDAVERANEDG